MFSHVSSTHRNAALHKPQKNAANVLCQQFSKTWIFHSSSTPSWCPALILPLFFHLFPRWNKVESNPHRLPIASCYKHRKQPPTQRPFCRGILRKPHRSRPPPPPRPTNSHFARKYQLSLASRLSWWTTVFTLFIFDFPLFGKIDKDKIIFYLFKSWQLDCKSSNTYQPRQTNGLDKMQNCFATLIN